MCGFRDGRRKIGAEPLLVARHPCGTDCSHTYKSHAPGQRSKARNNTLVCRARQCCQLNSPAKKKKKLRKTKMQTKTHKSETTESSELVSNGTARVQEPPSPPQSPWVAQAWDTPSQGAQHGSSVLLQNQHIGSSFV